jgi:DNA endonuclease
VPSRAGVKLRPTVEREELYRLVLQLRKDGLSYNKIIKKIEAEHGVTLRKSHISGWINGKHNPFGYVSRFDATPTPDLAYVIGVKMGDASTSVSHYNHMIKLRVTDKDFAEEFSKSLSKILQRSPPKVKWHDKTRAWHVQASSLLLQRFLLQPISELRSSIFHCKACMSAFVRGFFDSEGTARGKLAASNGDLDKLALVTGVLEGLGIEVTGPHLVKEKGGTVIIKGHEYRVNKDQYYIYVRTTSRRGYHDLIGFSIARKKKDLEGLIGDSSRRNSQD